MNFREKVQATLDDVLLGIPVYSFWIRRAETGKMREYVVYDIEEDEPDTGADGEIIVYNNTALLRYFCVEEMSKTAEGIEIIQNRLKSIRNAFLVNGFDIETPWQNAGDVDAIDFITFIIEVNYKEVMNGLQPD